MDSILEDDNGMPLSHGCISSYVLVVKTDSVLPVCGLIKWFILHLWYCGAQFPPRHVHLKLNCTQWHMHGLNKTQKHPGDLLCVDIVSAKQLWMCHNTFCVLPLCAHWAASKPSEKSCAPFEVWEEKTRWRDSERLLFNQLVDFGLRSH